MIHITALEAMSAELIDLGINITEHDLITTIICSVSPVRYESLLGAWGNVPDAERTMPALRERFLSVQRRLVRRQMDEKASQPLPPPPSGSDNSALQASGTQRGHFNRGYRGGRARGGSPRDIINRDVAKCNYCGKARHYEFECRLRIAHEGEKQLTPIVKKPNYDGDGPGPSRRVDFSLISICYNTAADPNAIYLDSGATRHMCGVREYFADLQDIAPGSWPVNGIGGTVLHAHGVGTIQLCTHVHDDFIHGELKNVLYVPGLGVNLISIVCLSINGFSVSFHGTEATISQDSTVFMTASRDGESLYKLDAVISPTTSTCLAAASTQATLNIWHARLGHVNRRAIQRMAAGLGVTGMDVTPGSTSMDECCHGCEVGKMHKLPFAKSMTRYDTVGACIVSDLVGPIHVPSVGGARYYVVFKDLYSKYKAVYFLQHKSETADCFLKFTKKVFTDTRQQVTMFRCDGGTEYINNAFQTTLLTLGIQLQTSAPYTPEQNGIAERDHRSSVEAARSLLHARGVPLKMWAEAVNYSVYVLNRTLSNTATVTPFERWFGVRPDVSHLRVFGSVAYIFVPDALRQKLDPKALKGVYVGESEEQKASRVFVEATGRTHITRHVKVYENLPYWAPVGPSATDVTPPVPTVSVDAPPADVKLEPGESLPIGGVKRPLPAVGLPLRKSARGLVPKRHFPMDVVGDFASLPAAVSMCCFISMALKSGSLYYEPSTFQEAMDGPEGELWKLAADAEMAAHVKNSTWTLVPLPPGRVCIPSGWAFTLKTDRLGLPCRRKARFFAKGYRQVQGVDYQESFAPVVRYDSLRVILALTAARDLELIQLDVTTAFLNGVIDELVFIAQPEGYVVPGREREVCRLNKGIYGICQASRIWNKTLHDALIEYGFTQSAADPCVYVLNRSDLFLIIAVWVDDGLVAGSSVAAIDHVVAYLNRKFEIKAILAELFVGMVITRVRAARKIYVAIPQFIDKILAKFNLAAAHPVSLPVLKGTPRLSREASPSSPAAVAAMSSFPFREAVGCLMYAALTVRIDIAFMAGQLAQFCQNPGMDHWTAATRVLRYLKATRNHGLCFGGKDAIDNVLVGYSDADYAGDPTTRRSTSGYVFILNGAAVTWSSRKQPIVALSTMESEYIAASDSTREAVWLRRLLDDLGEQQREPTLLRCDNESAIGLAYNPLAHKGSKHIEVRYHYIREQVTCGNVEVVHVRTQNQFADVLTKAVDGETYLNCLAGFGLCEVPQV